MKKRLSGSRTRHALIHARSASSHGPRGPAQESWMLGKQHSLGSLGTVRAIDPSRHRRRRGIASPLPLSSALSRAFDDYLPRPPLALVRDGGFVFCRSALNTFVDERLLGGLLCVLLLDLGVVSLVGRLVAALRLLGLGLLVGLLLVFGFLRLGFLGLVLVGVVVRLGLLRR